jgi:hypothetical protein
LTPLNGLISQIITRKKNGLPEWTVVNWENGQHSIEPVINEPFIHRKVQFFCPKCQTLLTNFYHPRQQISCPNCCLILWQDSESIPNLQLNQINPPAIEFTNIPIAKKKIKKSYEGKFKDTPRINMGQSPGARSSVSEQFFSVQRYFDIPQGLISDYLNLKRIQAGYSKQKLTKEFPPDYRHTVGHWLRKDMGGCLPKSEDIQKLQVLLNLDDSYVDFVSRMGIKFQTVLANTKGKNPGDFWELSEKDFIKTLERIGD